MSSSVPSPTSQFGEFLTRATNDLDKVTTHASTLPLRSDLSFHRTLNKNLAKELDETSERILSLTKRLLSLVQDETKSAKRRKLQDEDDVMDGYRRGVVEVVDGLLEDADSALDEVNGQKRKAAIEIKPSLAAAAGQKMPGPFSAASSSKTSFQSPQSLPRPQLQFPDVVDNSVDRSPFKPSLHFKHHAMVPLDHPVTPIGEGSSIDQSNRAMLHPYLHETLHLQYPSSMFSYSKPTPPAPIQQTRAEWVDTPESLAEMVEELKTAKEIAVDLEHHDAYSYYGFTCLMQISTREKDWLIDVIKLRGAIREEKLGGVFADPDIVKVFHGADSDIVWLQKDFDLYVVNLFDTYHATKVLDMTSHSLANLLQVYCDFTADKKYQLADWRIRPLTPEMRFYAQADTHFLLYIYDQLKNALLDKSRAPSPALEGDKPADPSPETNPQRSIRQVLSRSANTALKVYDRTAYDVETGLGSGGWKNFLDKYVGKNRPPEFAAMSKALHIWRDNVAREEDVSTVTVLSPTTLIALAGASAYSPTTETIMRIVRSPIAVARAGEILAVMERAQQEWQQAEKEERAAATPVVDSTSFKPRQVKKDVLEKGAKPIEGTKEGRDDVVMNESTSTPASADSQAKSVGVSEEEFWGTSISAVNNSTSNKKASKQSSLFGKTIKAGPDATQPQASARSSSSKMFGSTLKSKASNSSASETSGSSTYAEVHKAILEDIAGPSMVEPMEERPKKVERHVPEPETVPFVPASARSTTAPHKVFDTKEQPETESSAAPQSTPAPPHRDPSPEAVPVKRSKKSSKKLKDKSESEPNMIAKKRKAETAEPVEVASKKKAPVKVEDIPAFDYSAAPDWLSNPETARAKKGKKGKDKRDKPVGVKVTDTKYGKATQDKSQPKSGNRSMTFK